MAPLKSPSTNFIAVQYIPTVVTSCVLQYLCKDHFNILVANSKSKILAVLYYVGLSSHPFNNYSFVMRHLKFSSHLTSLYYGSIKSIAVDASVGPFINYVAQIKTVLDPLPPSITDRHNNSSSPPSQLRHIAPTHPPMNKL